MLNNASARDAIAGIIEPPARFLLKIGVTPDMVTLVGALGASLTAIILVPRGEFILAIVILLFLTLSDLLDGTMARMRGTAGPWGNFLDSTLDRVTDASIFCSLLWWCVLNDEEVAGYATLVCVVAGVAISYSKARAESLGATANVGIMERAERLIVVGVAGLLTGFGVDSAMPVLMPILAALSVITVFQRFIEVRRQLIPGPGSPEMAISKPQFSDLAYAAGWSAVRKMPEKAAYRTFDLIADRLWARRGKQILRFEKNLGRAMPGANEDELRQASKAGMRSYFTYWCDAFRMPDWPQERILGLPIVDEHFISDALGAAKGLVITAPHAGNYDHGAAFLAQKYGSMTTVMERLKPEALFERFVEFREALGMEVLGTGDPGAVDLLVERARANRIVCLVGDRDLTRGGVPVDFFGEPTKMPAGPAVTAIRSGAPLSAVSFWYEGRAGRVRVYPPVEFDREAPEPVAVAQATQLIADDLAHGIAAHPIDWHMLQPLWLADLDPNRAPKDA